MRMIRPFFAIFICTLTFLHASSAVAANDEVLALLTRDGGEIQSGDLAPGLVELTSDEAFALLKDAKGTPLAAGGETPDKRGGRVVAFAHDGFLKSPAMTSQEANINLIANAVRWCGRSSTPVVTLHPDLGGLADALTEKGFKTELVAPGDLASSRPPALYVVVAQRNFGDEDLSQLLACAENGTGLVIAATPWAFADAYPNFADFPANRLAAPAGIQLRAGGTADRSKPFAVRYASSDSVFEALEELSGGPVSDTVKRGTLIATLREGVSLRGEAMTRFIGGLKSLSEKIGPIIPTQENPLIPGAEPLVDALVAIEDELNQTLSAGRLYPIAAASNYPGAVPDDAPRLEKSLTLDGTWRGWLSGRGAAGWTAKDMRPTGLYAAPGEVITVRAPAKITGQGFEVVIGAYNGNLANRDKWERYPRLQRSVEIKSEVTTISNSLGGLITIRVPRGAGHGSLDFHLAGGVAAPLYIAGETDLNEWRTRIRKSPAPWAELASDRIILAIPSSFIRDLDDPDKVMQVWDEIIEKSAELCGGVDRNLYRAERIVFERQTSAGYMHSSYPVAAPQDNSANQAVDARALREEGNWGFFHEYGHNHQHDLWALPGTGETTCNLWSVYLFEEWVGKPRAEGHNAIRPLDRKQRMNAYFQGGRKFESDWSMWVALETYLQVQETFGWEPFIKVFAEYNTLPESEWPKTQQEKNDQWVIRLSRACGKNLAPFWQKWNLPLTDLVNESLRDLPVWEDHPVTDL